MEMVFLITDVELFYSSGCGQGGEDHKFERAGRGREAKEQNILIEELPKGFAHLFRHGSLHDAHLKSVLFYSDHMFFFF